MTAKLFEAALGIAAPWSVNSVEFDEGAKLLTVLVDFEPGTHFAVAGYEGTHPVHDTVAKTYRHLNFFQHECHLHVRTPRVKLPNGSVRLVEPISPDACRASTLLFEALVLMLAQQMPLRRLHASWASPPIGSWKFAIATSRWRWGWPTSAMSLRWPSTRPRVPGGTTT
ncbi:hypothetical protein [Variovorax sp. WS11]|uniref:hypothetical protein n=1 Tax=Variovorax sp. WS11 TaxID=1105204 RepID=UPI001EF2C0D5|nr:hypothetical protein [Variovorax sp. WS11]